MSFPIRIAKLRRALLESDFDGMVIIDRANTFYLSGFRGSASILIIMPDVAIFLTDSRYYERARKILSVNFDVILLKGDGKEQIKSFFGIRGKLRIAFESAVSYEKYCWLSKAVRPARLIEAGKLVRDLRLQKDEHEIRCIRRAASITDKCMAQICSEIKPGITERDVAIRIRRFFEDAGAEGESFPCIVASGPNAALPHHEVSRRKLKSGDVVLIDLGCIVGGYCSDMTRTVYLGSVSDEEKEIYNIVLESQKKGLKAVEPGILAKQVDAIVRDYISKCGYGDAFGHNTGHGVGISVHEFPSIGRTSSAVLKEGMVITIEPGIYIPGFTGVRIEDLVLVTGDGGRRLSKSTKKLRVL
jgi:Xaa-Pro aminopeptidase